VGSTPTELTIENKQLILPLRLRRANGHKSLILLQLEAVKKLAMAAHANYNEMLSRAHSNN